MEICLKFIDRGIKRTYVPVRNYKLFFVSSVYLSLRLTDKHINKPTSAPQLVHKPRDIWPCYDHQATLREIQTIFIRIRNGQINHPHSHKKMGKILLAGFGIFWWKEKFGSIMLMTYNYIIKSCIILIQ